MKQFIVSHGYIIDTNAEGIPHLNSRVFAAVDKADTNASGARSLAAQASLAAEAIAALRAVVDNCALIHKYGGEADNTLQANVAEAAAHAVLAKVENMQRDFWQRHARGTP